MTQSPHRERTDFGADPAFVASQSSRHGVSTKGFDHGEGDCPYGSENFGQAIAWHEGFRAGLKSAERIWMKAMGA